MNHEPSIDDNMRAEADRAWANNRAEVGVWLEGLKVMAEGTLGADATPANINAILELALGAVIQNDSQFANKAPTLLAALATMAIYGGDSSVPDTALPPMITTDESGPQQHRFGF